MDWTPLYRNLTDLGAPLIEKILQRRLARGREDPERLEERRGISNIPRPEGSLLWLHAASIGEAQSVLTLIKAIRRLYPGLSMIMTTGTVSSAKIMTERLPEGVIHQFAPLDRLPWVRAFLGHWRPDAAIWIESEFWPNMLVECRRRGPPMVMLNARISARSTRLWSLLPGRLRPVLGGFRQCLAQDETQAARLRRLGAKAVKVVGNIKYAADPLPFDPKTLTGLKRSTKGRPLWLAASTHPGEEEQIIEVHRRLQEALPNLLTVIVPRHPSRSQSLAALLQAEGLRFAQRSKNEAVDASTEIYLGDSIGELGLFYRLCRIVFVGGSLVPRGGQNLLEPARLGCALLHGPHVWNFAKISEALQACGGAEEVRNKKVLRDALFTLLSDSVARKEMADSAEALAREEALVLTRILDELEPLLASLCPPAAQAEESQ